MLSWKVVKRKWRRARVRVLRGGAPAEMAGGMALGLFVALLPVLGLQLPLALLFAEAIRRLTHLPISRVAAAAGVWLNNPLTAAPVYSLCYLVGRPLAHRLLPSSSTPGGPRALDWSTLSPSSPEALEVALGLVLGAVILGVPIAWVGYRVTYDMVSRQRARREERRARRTRTLSMASGT